ncbi:transcription repressor NadR [Collinsella sp. AGMB00827]|uniref:Transcription repressor NadR n=1 Tax=Collinsella ureilytica TaxID=2869515 RepID=A0ABS7MK45_9ACTN|nr:transcription repressor NadR [Collinsella urealyticum]MBY4797632.1 transcription repressor NadR [Collinsella urealyticum]
MRGEIRRDAILKALAGSKTPISGTALAREAGVSRQVIVQDIALLRANGHDLVATARGYVLREDGQPALPARLIKVRHGEDDLAAELNCIVDLGGAVQTVMVNHRVYGKITADLDIRSRRDVARYLEGIRSGKSVPLMTVTSGYHYHRITADTEELLDEIEEALGKLGFLAEVFPYEKEDA